MRLFHIYTNTEFDIMRKYLIRYFIFWAPAILSTYFLEPLDGTGRVAQWFLGFFMLLGWAINSGMAAYNHPRGTLAFITAYIGVNAVLITVLVNTSLLVNTSFGAPGYAIFDHAAGAFTFRPLYMLYDALRNGSSVSQEEMWIAGIVAAACLVGFVCGVLSRQLNPDPIRPKFIR